MHDPKVWQDLLGAVYVAKKTAKEMPADVVAKAGMTEAVAEFIDAAERLRAVAMSVKVDMDGARAEGAG